MAQAQSNTQLPIGSEHKTPLQDEMEAFQEGIALGRQYADVAARRIAAWAEENPGQMLLVGVAAGFVLGKLLFRPRRIRIPDLDVE
jgi:hypothetical protein